MQLANAVFFSQVIHRHSNEGSLPNPVKLGTYQGDESPLIFCDGDSTMFATIHDKSTEIASESPVSADNQESPDIREVQ